MLAAAGLFGARHADAADCATLTAQGGAVRPDFMRRPIDTFIGALKVAGAAARR